MLHTLFFIGADRVALLPEIFVYSKAMKYLASQLGGLTHLCSPFFYSNDFLIWQYCYGGKPPLIEASFQDSNYT